MLAHGSKIDEAEVIEEPERRLRSPQGCIDGRHPVTEMDLLSPRAKEGFGNLEQFVPALHAVVVGWTVAHHEPWADEAQTWFFAKDLSILYLVGKYVRADKGPLGFRPF